MLSLAFYAQTLKVNVMSWQTCSDICFTNVLINAYLHYFPSLHEVVFIGPKEPCTRLI
jgi:hypothetical protein